MEKPTNNSRAKLELKVNQPVTAKLLKDKPFEGDSAYGSYILYSLEVAGSEVAYFAPPEVHQQIKEFGFRTGDEIVLRKVAIQNGRKIVGQVVVEPVKKEAHQEPVLQKAEVQKPEGTDNLRAIMERSLQDAVDIVKSVQGVPFQTTDIQKLASCLFIART